MSRRFTKIICAVLSAVVALGILLVAGCKKGYTDKALSGKDIFVGEVDSNGGFAVEKGNYIYFINGIQGNSANNDYGKPVKGAISRISKADFADRNYSKTDIVVPQIAYSANHNAGIFIYGDSVYYGTPSTSKNSEGVVQSQNLVMQSTKLDRSRTSAPYITFKDASYDYRFVEVEDTVYLIYVATGETLFKESNAVTNIHSLNTRTGKNTLLAYNVSSYMFDAEDKTNARIYYTMSVQNYSEGGNSNYYNQVYTVTADATEANEYDTSKIIGWDKDKDHYINCGTLVFEGRGKGDKTTPFNYGYPEDNTDTRNLVGYNYTLKTYVNNTLVFTRSSKALSEQYLYTYKDGAIADSDPIKLNTALEDKELLKNGVNADKFKYIFDEKGDIKAVLFAEGSDSGISVNYIKADGKLHEKQHEEGSLKDSKYFNIVKDGTATLLFLDREKEFAYYSISGVGNNGYSMCRVSYASDDFSKYEANKFEPDEFSPIQILDVDVVTDWYLPEIIENQIVYASASSDMTLYSYIMVCDLRNDKGELMEPSELRDFNKLYDDVKEDIEGFSNGVEYPSDKYQNIQNVINYGFFTQDTKYIYKHQKKVNEKLGKDDNRAISDETIEEYLAFIHPTEDGKWKEYAGKAKTVNGVEVYATNRGYYYSLLGKMSSSDKKAYQNALVSSYLPTYVKETKTTWWKSIGKTGRTFFVLGMLASAITLGNAVAVLVVFLMNRNRNKGTVTKRRRIRVDTTDDKTIDVYNN